MIIAKASRTSRTAAVIAAVGLLAGGISPAFAVAADPEASAPAAASKPQGQPVKKARQICVKTEITGSRLPHTVCKTRDEWIQQEGVDPLNLQAR